MAAQKNVPGRLNFGKKKSRSISSAGSSSNSTASTSSFGMFGVLGKNVLATIGVRTASPDDDESEPINKRQDSVIQGTRFTFHTDSDSVETYYVDKRFPGSRMLLMRGILTIERRLVNTVQLHASGTDDAGPSRGISTPFKASIKPGSTSVALEASYKRKRGSEVSSCNFLVPYGRRLLKSSYENFTVWTGIDSGTVSVVPEDKNIWKTFIDEMLHNFDVEAVGSSPDDSTTIRFHWNKVGLQSEYCPQEQEIYIMNSAIILKFNCQLKSFERVSFADAKYSTLSLNKKSLPQITISARAPDLSFLNCLRDSLGVHFVTLICLMGHAVISFKPHFPKDKLGTSHPSVILFGPPNTGKTLLAELAAAIGGTEQIGDKAFSFQGMTEFMYGQRSLSTSAPTVVNDPPKDDIQQYASMMCHSFDASPRVSKSITYVPGGGLILCISYDAMDFIRKNRIWTERLRTRVVTLHIKECITMPNSDEEYYKKMQRLSFHLPDLLFLDECRTKADVKYYSNWFNESMEDGFADDSGRSRIASCFGLFYALGEHVSRKLLPDFEFRSAARTHIQSYSIPCALEYQSMPSTLCDKKAPKKRSGQLRDIGSFVSSVIQFAVLNPAIKWYNYVNWSLVMGGKASVAIASAAFRDIPDFPRADDQDKIMGLIKSNPLLGVPKAAQPNFRIPQSVNPLRQKKVSSTVLFTDEFYDDLKQELKVMHSCSMSYEYGPGWELKAQAGLLAIQENRDDDTVAPTTAEPNGAEQDGGDHGQTGYGAKPEKMNVVIPPPDIAKFCNLAVRCQPPLEEAGGVEPSDLQLDFEVIDEPVPMVTRVEDKLVDSHSTAQHACARNAVKSTGLLRVEPTFIKREDVPFVGWYALSGKMEIETKLKLAHLPCTTETVHSMAKAHWDALSTDDQIIALKSLFPHTFAEEPASGREDHEEVASTSGRKGMKRAAGREPLEGTDVAVCGYGEIDRVVTRSFSNRTKQAKQTESCTAE